MFINLHKFYYHNCNVSINLSLSFYEMYVFVLYNTKKTIKKT